MELLDKDLIEIGIQMKNKETLLEYMGTKLLNKGSVKSSYPKAVSEREKNFPTGISSRDLGIAIPHTNASHVKQPKVAIGILKDPVKFQMMGEPEKNVDVSIIIMIAINNPDMQIEFLQKLVSIIENHELLNKLKNSGSAEEIYNLLDFLNNIEE